MISKMYLNGLSVKYANKYKHLQQVTRIRVFTKCLQDAVTKTTL